MIFAWLENKIPRLSFVKRRMNDDVLIICADNLAIYYLNSTAAMFIELADGKSTVGDIKKKFLARYDVDERELENDFVEMIRDLQWKKILTLE
ncbi:MAG: PqqD family protein [Selenomonadaceae bacterium]|nr:PqqD family protein [Selenomonadaceae bacterium]